MKTFILSCKFTKEEVRAWLNLRHLSRELATRRLAADSARIALFDTFSENLLRLYQFSRGTTAPEFLEKVGSFFVQEFDIRRAWWGLSPQELRSSGPSIGQAGYLKLPGRALDDWLRLTPESAFSNEIERNPEQGPHVSCSRVQNAYPQRVYELIEGTDLRHAMGLCLDWQGTGQRFFATLFRGRDDERFSDHEALLLLHLLRHVLQIWHHKLQDALSGFPFVSCSELAVARKDGRIVYIGANMHALLASMCAHWNGIAIPADLLREGEKIPGCRRLNDSVLNMFSRDDYIWLVNVNSSSGPGTDWHVRHAASTASA